jgi:hypothetical protein
MTRGKALLGSIAVGVVVLTGVGPAFAQDWGDYYEQRGSGDPDQAVQQCAAAAERVAGRQSYGRADVTDIRNVDRNRRGYSVLGRIAVNGPGRDWRGDGYYGRSWNSDYRGWDGNRRTGWFRCTVEYGRIADLHFSGIRGL